MKKILALVFLVCSISLVGLQAQTKWNMATPYGDSYFQTKNVREFTADVEKILGVSINVHPGGSLFPATEIFRAVRGGQAEMGELLMASMGNEDPIFKIDSIPFVASSYSDSKKLWDASKVELTKRLDKMGVVLLYAVPWPPQNFYTKSKVEQVSFFKGAKLRSYNAVTAQMADLLGSVPTTVQVPEIPQAFSTGIIDAMITSGSTGVSSQAWDYTKYYIEVQAWLPKNMVFINKKTWRRLKKNEQSAILKLAEEAELRGWSYSEAANKSDRETLAANGMEIITPSKELNEAMNAVGDQMVKNWIKEVGPEGQKIIDQMK